MFLLEEYKVVCKKCSQHLLPKKYIYVKSDYELVLGSYVLSIFVVGDAFYKTES